MSPDQIAIFITEDINVNRGLIVEGIPFHLRGIDLSKEHPEIRAVVNKIIGAKDGLFGVARKIAEKYGHASSEPGKKIYDACYYGFTNADSWDGIGTAVRIAQENLTLKQDQESLNMLQSAAQALWNSIREAHSVL
jgi:hypothetical protein